MENLNTSINATIQQMQHKLLGLQEDVEDLTLTQADLEAIEAGDRDYKLGRTRRL